MTTPDLKKAWLLQCLELSQQPADFYSGARKIVQNVHFTLPQLDSSLTLADCGFTKSKLSMLHRNYYNQPSIDAALELWAKRVAKNKYGSVGISTYNHFMKGDVKGATPRGSVMGPCIQAVTLTLNDNRTVTADVFYRTTELFKKFPADLVFLRDTLLHPFGPLDKLHQINFHFANVTCHPMYFVTIIPHLSRPTGEMDLIRRADKRFYDWLIKWTARYVCPEHSRGIQKFSQALRVQKDALERLKGQQLKTIQKYLRDNHPGHRNAYEDDGEDE